jgi:transcriptional regulator with XRE-family HTH domain
MFLMNERTIGARIRRLRREGGRTLTSLAAEAGMAKGTLSKIENGQVSAPVSSLLRLADAMGVPLADFFVEEDAARPFVLTRRGAGRPITRDGSRFGYAYEALALGRRRKLAEPFLLTVNPGDPPGAFRHGGEEFIFMLAGTLAFTIDGEELVLRRGDSLYLDPTHPHTTRVIGSRPARFLCVFMQAPTP